MAKGRRGGRRKGGRRRGYVRDRLGRFAKTAGSGSGSRSTSKKSPKKKCGGKSYGCGGGCLSLAKECRKQPESAIGKQRIKRVQALSKSLAAGNKDTRRGLGRPGQKGLDNLVNDLNSRRSAKASQLLESRRKKPANNPGEPGVKLSAARVSRSKQSSLGKKVVAAKKDAEKRKLRNAYDEAESRVKLANKYYGKGTPSRADAEALGLKRGERVNATVMKRFQDERDRVRKALDKQGEPEKRRLQPGKAISTAEMRKPLSDSEIKALGERGRMPDPSKYPPGSERRKDAIRYRQQYAEAKKQAPGLTEAEYVTIRNYTRKAGVENPGYIGSNSAARGLFKDPNTDIARRSRTDARLTDSALSKLPDFKGEVRRDTKLPTRILEEYGSALKTGKAVEFKGVTSTTSDLKGSATKNYGVQTTQAGANVGKESGKASTYTDTANKLGIKTLPDEDAVRVEYRLNVTTGKNISKISVAGSEEEVALRHGWRGKVTDMRTERDRVVVYMDEE